MKARTQVILSVEGFGMAFAFRLSSPDDLESSGRINQLSDQP
jgi:hypothetical protein